MGTLLNLWKDKRPQYLAVIYDSRGPGRRRQIYPQYKENRGPIDPALAAQQEPIKELVKDLGIFSLEMPGFEADDIIASLCRRLANQGLDVVIVSGDKDFYQLLSDKVSMFDPSAKKKSAMTAEDFRLEYGLEPEAFLEMQGLMGDASDNIPGIPKIGIVTAKKLIQDYGTIENLYQNLDKIKSPTIRQNLAQNQDKARLSLELARLGVPDFPEIPLTDFQPRKPDLKTLSAKLKELAFVRLVGQINRLFGDEDIFAGLPTQPPAPRSTENGPEAATEAMVVAEVDYGQYVLVNETSFETLLNRLSGAKTIALDLETDSLKAYQAAIVGLSLAVAPNEAYYLPFGHLGLEAAANLNWAQSLQRLRPILLDPQKKLIGQNSKFDWLILARHGLNLPAPQDDPMLASYLLDPDASHKLDDLSLRFLGHRPIPFKDLVDPKKTHFGSVDLATATKYAAEDADLTWRLAEKLRQDLQRAPELLDLYDKLELPLAELLARMENVGVKIDKFALAILGERLGQDILALEKKIHALAGHAFNIGSPKQLGTVLFQELGLKEGKKTAKKTAYSTDSEVLKELALFHPIASEVLAWRESSKLKNTYVDKLPLSTDEFNRTHTTYNQTQTATGRLSSSDPNLQNIPARSRDGQMIRAAFVAEPGHVLVGADYSQIELRIMAHFSQDEAMVSAFRDNEDIHAQTAAKIFGANIAAITPEERRQAKTINFGVIYGQGAFGLAKQLGIPQSSAKTIIDDYFARFPGVKSYMDRVKKEARLAGQTRTWFGRIRRLLGFESGGFQAQREAERVAINTPIQGTAADIIKMAMLQADKELKAKNLKAQLILQVHDELVAEAPVEEAEEVGKILTESMRQVGRAPFIGHQGPIIVELRADVAIGANWAKA
jgi:DNA polymerase-1